MNSRYVESDWSNLQTTKKLSAMRQINAAIEHLRVGDFECAATLALAAEGQLPEPSATHILKAIKQNLSNKSDIDILNDLRNWLKHDREPSEREISQFEIAIAVLRASSKYFAVFREKTPEMDAFILWCVSKGLLTPP
jgi:hypothetical protein